MRAVGADCTTGADRLGGEVFGFGLAAGGRYGSGGGASGVVGGGGGGVASANAAGTNHITPTSTATATAGARAFESGMAASP